MSYFTVSNGLRTVTPYDFTFEVFVKGRWANRPLLEVMKSEFPHYPDGYHAKAIAEGRIRVDEAVVDPAHIIVLNNVVSHKIHRHEARVLDVPLQVLYRDDALGILVVNKPPSVPVHPCGRYNRNTVLYQLEHDLGIIPSSSKEGTHACHRIDKVTSGVLLLATKRHLKVEISRLLEQHDGQVTKRYLARVSGKVVSPNNPEGAATFQVDYPIAVADHKTGRVRCLMDPAEIAIAIEACEHTKKRTREDFASLEEKRKWIQEVTKPQDPEAVEKAKTALTLFNILAYDAASDSTLLECTPRTGRTHQIRVHLASIGHPILNDKMYGGRPYGLGGPMSSLLEVPSPPPYRCESCGDTIITDDGVMYICLHAWQYEVPIEGKHMVFVAPPPAWGDMGGCER